jgi:hypothetical protein
MSRIALLLAAAVLALSAAAGLAQTGGMSAGGMKMKMPMAEGPAHFQPTRQAYTTNHAFLVKLVALPTPIPYQKYFALRFAVYSGRPPHRRLPDAQLSLSAGMRHGLKHGFAHGMNSSPKIAKAGDVFTIEGMYFHMMGPWVAKLTVAEGGKEGIAYFRLPCCGT